MIFQETNQKYSPNKSRTCNYVKCNHIKCDDTKIIVGCELHTTKCVEM